METLAGEARALARRGLEELAEALWPARCRLCGSRSQDLVACTDHRLPEAPPGARCGRCAAALGEGLPDGARCGACTRRAPAWRRLIALGDYRAQPVLRDWLFAFKHGARRSLAEPLGARLAARWIELATAQDELQPLFVPVPLHPLRRWERGLDQAALLAGAVARHTGGRELAVLRRRRDTPLQGAPGAVSRRANVREAFSARRGARRRLEGRALWLVDDVVTSGATAGECARLLRRLGARHVDVLTLARAGPAGRVGYPDPA